MAEQAVTAIALVTYDVLIKVGVPAAVAEVIAVATGYALVYGGTAAASAALTRSSLPKTKPSGLPIRQPFASRVFGGGRARLSGVYTLYEVDSDGNSLDVLYVCEGGPAGGIDALEQWYLGDDAVTLRTGQFGPGNAGENDNTHTEYRGVYLDHRLGAATETAYTRSSSQLAGNWGANYRGDGCASIEMMCVPVKAKNFQSVYPTGIPNVSAVWRLAKVCDLRDEDHAPATPATWEWDDNPVNFLATYLAGRTGDIRDWYARKIEPLQAMWEQAADDCEEAVTLAAGGTEDRYRWGGAYALTDPWGRTVDRLLKTFDGFMAERGDGALAIYAGKYRAPTVTITSEHVVAVDVSKGRPTDERRNVLEAQFTNPATGYNAADVDPWRDESHIADFGESAGEVDLEWVPSHSQARRLLKRAMVREASDLTARIQLNMYGARCLGQRWLNYDFSDSPEMAALFGETGVWEITGLSFDPNEADPWFLSVVEIDPVALEAWTPSADEGVAPQQTTAAGSGGPPGITIKRVETGQSGGLSYVDIVIAAPTVTIDVPIIGEITSPRTDLTFVAAWRTSAGDGGTPAAGLWNEVEFDNPEAVSIGGTQWEVTLRLNAVPAGELDVRALSVTEGARGTWSDIEQIAVGVDNPDAPGDGDGGTL